MVEVVAIKKGYYGGRIIEVGEAFTLLPQDWANKARRPNWARPRRREDEESEQEAVKDEVLNRETKQEAVRAGMPEQGYEEQEAVSADARTGNEKSMAVSDEVTNGETESMAEKASPQATPKAAKVATKSK